MWLLSPKEGKMQTLFSIP